MLDPVLVRVKKRISQSRVSYNEAASEIGVTQQSLLRHLSGEYVRSDSLAKYRLWLEGGQSESGGARPFVSELTEQSRQDAEYGPTKLFTGRIGNVNRHRVVDLFCGCGGMSLGYDRYMEGKVFRTVLAVDIEKPMIRVFNDNHGSFGGELAVGRQADMTDFMNVAEILAYYLDHLARSGQDDELMNALRKVGPAGLDGFRSTVFSLDQQFIEHVSSIRESEIYTEAYKKMGASVLSQTSVKGFHQILKLPMSGLGRPRIGTLLWHDDGSVKSIKQLTPEPDGELMRACAHRMRRLWKGELNRLSERSGGSGQGQLSSAAQRIDHFVKFTESSSMRQIKDAWIEWRASREAARIVFFDDFNVQNELQSLYENGRQVSILLGGPPCQGFSRIGRGKIRSLREQRVHVQESKESGDSRNQLMHQYVLFVAALAPRIFLFENVRHFQAVVKTSSGDFDASDILAESIENVSSKGLGYVVDKRIIVASQHLVPQARERFFMVGVRTDVDKALGELDGARWCISLQTEEPVT